MENDNWSHRQGIMMCGACMFFMLKKTKVAQAEGHFLGRCRESSPTVKGWPAVWSDDWCGAHKLDEEKI